MIHRFVKCQDKIHFHRRNDSHLRRIDNTRHLSWRYQSSISLPDQQVEKALPLVPRAAYSALSSEEQRQRFPVARTPQIVKINAALSACLQFRQPFLCTCETGSLHQQLLTWRHVT